MLDSIFNRSKFWRPISIASGCSDHIIDLPARNIEGFAPILNAEPNSINSNPDVSRCISALHQHGRPLTICRLIISIIIDAINRVSFGRPKLHISKKILETIQPAFTYLNSAPTIAMILRRIRIAASIFHLGPNTPFSRIALTMKIGSSQPVYSQRGSRTFASQATTTKRALADIGCGDYSPVSAVTLAFPHSISRFWSYGSLKNNQSAMTLASKIKGSRHLIFPFLSVAIHDKCRYIGREVNA